MSNTDPPDKDPTTALNTTNDKLSCKSPADVSGESTHKSINILKRVSSKNSPVTPKQDSKPRITSPSTLATPPERDYEHLYRELKRRYLKVVESITIDKASSAAELDQLKQSIEDERKTFSDKLKEKVELIEALKSQNSFLLSERDSAKSRLVIKRTKDEEIACTNQKPSHKRIMN